MRPPPTQSPDRARTSAARDAAAGSRGPLIHVTTRCVSIDEFVVKFAGFASAGTLVLPAAGELPTGTEGRFVIRLADQSVAMRGRCRVIDVKTMPASPSTTGPRRTLLRVALLDLEEGSRGVHARLLAHRRESVPLPVSPDASEPTLVSPQSPVPPPPLRTPPPPPIAGPSRTMTMIGVAPASGPAASKPVAAPPPVNALARTMIGVTPAAGPIAAAAGPPPAERRVPGAAFTLPANPLSALHAGDLASVVDSTLFETDDDDATAERPAQPTAEVDVPIEEVASERAAPTEVAVERTSPVAGRGKSPTRPAAIRLAPYALCLVVGLLLGRAWLAPARNSRPVPAAAASAGAPAPVPSPAPAPVVAPAQPEAAPKPTAASPAAVAPAQPEVTPKPAAASAPAAEPAPPEATPNPAAAQAVPESGVPGECTARIATEPSDAKITWGGKLLGQSPVERARIPCGVGILTIEHERYQSVTQQVTAAPGAAVVVSQRLHRPPGTLIVSSSPPRAYVTVNDQMLGPAPRRLAAWRYEQVSIRATFPGYQPWTKKIYLKEPTTTITAQLVPTGRGGDAAKHSAAAR